MLEETAHDFEPTALMGVYLNRFTKTRTGDDMTYLRFAFAGTLGTHHDWRTLDAGIVRTRVDDARRDPRLPRAPPQPAAAAAAWRTTWQASAFR